jgi:hypothetical protein
VTLRLLIIALILIAVSVAMTDRSPPAIYSGGALPVPVDELMELNPD